MKRFTETSKWDDPWFRSLTGPQKLVFLYVIDRCDNAGFWEEDESALVFHTKLEIKYLEGAWKGLTRGLERANGWVWVKNFLRHQKNEELNQSNPAHRQIIRLLAEQLQRFDGIASFQSFLAPYKGLFSPIGIGNGKGKEESTRETKARGSQADLIQYCSEIGLPASDGEWLFDKWEGNGWKNDGRTIKDWRGTVRTWKRSGSIFPSQKNGSNGHKPAKMFLTE
jgi:hypothetical protein